MQKVYPDYYKEFRCVAGDCVHSCCIGWEIDIDPDTEKKYKADSSALNFSHHIDFTVKPSHFILDEGERCPYLNARNLCDIIISSGDEMLCHICREHPRFHNTLKDRTESGLGLCCEEAARLILTNTSPSTLITEGEDVTDDEIILMRDKVISLLQNRSKSIEYRIQDMLSYCDAPDISRDIPRWAEFLLSLERLDEEWTAQLQSLRDSIPQADTKGFDKYMQDRQHEYEQLMVYIIYRHLATAPDTDEAKLRVQFAALCYLIIHAMGAVIFTRQGEFTISTQIELCRMLSSEIEYSDENLDKIYDELYFGE